MVGLHTTHPLPPATCFTGVPVINTGLGGTGGLEWCRVAEYPRSPLFLCGKYELWFLVVKDRSFSNFYC